MSRKMNQNGKWLYFFFLRERKNCLLGKMTFAISLGSHNKKNVHFEISLIGKGNFFSSTVERFSSFSLNVKFGLH